MREFMNSQHASPKSGKTQLYVGVYRIKQHIRDVAPQACRRRYNKHLGRMRQNLVQGPVWRLLLEISPQSIRTFSRGVRYFPSITSTYVRKLAFLDTIRKNTI